MAIQSKVCRKFQGLPGVQWLPISLVCVIIKVSQLMEIYKYVEIKQHAP